MNTDHHARQAAARRVDLEVAEATYAEAKDAADQLQRRIDAAKSARNAITQRRLAGESTEADASEFVALGGDLEVLESLHRDAVEHADAAKPDRERAALAQAEGDLRRATEQAKHDSLIEHAKQLEHLFLRSVKAIQDAARQRGFVRTFADCYKFDADLTAAIRQNCWIPER